MEKITLQPYLEIQGIGAASGLVCHEGSLFIISDNSTFLYEYLFAEKRLQKIKLLPNSAENLAKKDKADFEAITLFGNKLYVFGSGSTKKRDIRICYDLDTKEIKEKNLSKIHKRLRETIGLANDELNTEGIIIDEGHYYFFQRGNGASAQNGIFTYGKKNKAISFQAIALPKINGVEATFTDAVLVDGHVYFLAACENTSSTYNDGEIYGSFLGSLDLKTGNLRFVQQISDSQKFEGLALLATSAASLEFLICEDNDTEAPVSAIYKATLTIS